ncbi:MAG: class I SAM-dependent methyltransferase [Methylococcaceae bacterium]
MSNIIKELTKHNIHPYGSKELLKFEKNMEKYFSREYDRWQGNKALPEDYGISSFEGDIAKKETHIQSIDHYNNEFKIYQAFLDKKYMAYTMGYYITHENFHIDPATSLGDAQINKFNLIIERAEIKDGQSILEMGCGFGGFSKYLLEKFPNITITAINPSFLQTEHLKADGNRFTLIKKYFDDITEHDISSDSFDRVISIGVLEAVTNLDKLFKLISRILKTRGKTFHHFIVSRDTIPQFLNAEDTLMENYFPGGHIWPYSEAKRHAKYLKPVKSWYVNGMNYWKTLDVWHQKFWDNIDELYPEYLTLEEVDDWNKYFSLCKTMFSPNGGESYGNGHYLYEKE